MRRSDREITDIQRLLEIIGHCQVCRLALWDEMGPYLVPLNFGYTYEDGQLTLYFHSAKKGRKVDAIRQRPKAAFEMDRAHQLMEGKTACEYSFRYQSITGAGTISPIEDPAAKQQALEQIVAHQTGAHLSVPLEAVGGVAVFRLEADWFTGKEHL